MKKIFFHFAASLLASYARGHQATRSALLSQRLIRDPGREEPVPVVLFTKSHGHYHNQPRYRDRYWQLFLSKGV